MYFFKLGRHKNLAIFIIALFLVSFWAMGTAAQVDDQTQSNVNGLTETFVDLLGTVNYTYDPTGSEYEGKTFLSVDTLDPYSEQIEFAISVGGYHVFYYTFEDGSIPHTIEELYRDDIVTHVLYANDPRVSDDLKIHPEFDGSFKRLGLSDTAYSGGNNNLTVDTLDVSETETEWALAEMLANTSAAHIDSTIISASADSRYSKYKSDIINWNKADDLIASTGGDTDELENPVIETYGTENMTETVYIWLARYIEDALGVDDNTISITDDTESVTSEGITVMMDEDFHQTVRSIMDEELDAAGIDGFGAGALSKIGKSISKGVSKAGSFAFSAGMSTAKFVGKAATTATNVGFKGTKAVVSAAMTARNAVYEGGKYIAKGTAKAAKFVVDGAGKVAKKSFGFLGSVFKGVKKVVSFLLKYWWLWLSLLVIGFIFFAFPIGPFMMNNTVRRVIK